MKIRTRFTVLFSIIVGVILFFFSFSIYYLSENYRRNDFYSRLQDAAIVKLRILTLAKDKTNDLTSPNPSVGVQNPLVNEKIIIYDSNTHLLYQDTASPALTSEIISFIKAKNIYTYSEKNSEKIGFHYTYKGNSYLLFASAFDKYGTKYISNLKNTLIVRGFILMLIIMLSGWIYAGYFLEPISNIVQQTENISSGNLNYRITGGTKDDEIGQLTTAFNKMLERLETSFKIQKRFVSNASHELRNPLTAISGQIDVALMKDREKEDYINTLKSASKEMKSLINLSNNLLELAISDVETLFQNFVPLRVDEILWTLQEEFAIQKPEYTVHINFSSVVDNENLLTCKGNEKLLKAAFKNLIDNACKFSKNQTVEVLITFEQNNIVLFFKDSGIGIPENYLEHIFEPFYRAVNTQGIQGSGIGLALVMRIIKLHSGKILVQSKLNQGTTMEVIIPNLS